MKANSIYYYYCNQDGGNVHIVQLYTGYTKEAGLFGKGKEIENKRAALVLKELKNVLSTEQYKTLADRMKSGSHGVIIHTDGSTASS